MAEVKLKTDEVLAMLDLAVASGTELLLDKVKDEVPRDWKRPPKALDFKGKFYNKPRRNVREGNKRYYKPVVANGGKFYAWVSGDLGRSVGMEKISNGNYVVGVRSGPTEVYAWTQEFGDPSRNIVARSFLRKPLDTNSVLIEKRIIQTFSELLKNG